MFWRKSQRKGWIGINMDNEEQLMVIENFILWLTHVSESRDPDYDTKISISPRQLYEAATVYCEDGCV